MAVDDIRDQLWMINLCSKCRSNPVIRRMTARERAERENGGRMPPWADYGVAAYVRRHLYGERKRVNRLDVRMQRWLD